MFEVVEGELWWQKNHISQSKLDLFNKCQLAWWFRYVQKIRSPSKLWLPQGSSVHIGVENYLDDLKKGEVKDMTHYFLLMEMYWDENADDVREYHDKFVGQGFEGVMVRNPRMPYQMDKRSAGLMKFKDFKDDEYKIVGYTEATGNDAGTVIWTCVAPNGITFNVRPKGTREERTEAFNNADSYIGKMLTVRYFELTNDDAEKLIEDWSFVVDDLLDAIKATKKFIG